MHPNKASRRRIILATGIAALLSLAGNSPAQSLSWDPGTDGDGQIGGTGTWNLTNTFWDPTGADLPANNVVWPNAATSVAIFGGTAGVVTINTGSGVTANGLTFNTSGYQINSNVAADVLTLAGTSPTITVTNGGQSARINSIIAGTSGLSTAGAGTLILAGANTYTGVTTVGSGSTLALANVAALGANGAGSETIVSIGGTLNLGGQNIGVERITISGDGVGGVGALINKGQTRADNSFVQFLTLGANATVSAGASAGSFNAGGGFATGPAGRWDLRLAAYTAGAKNLDLAGNTLTKIGDGHFAIVNADVTAGNITINQGMVSLESGTTLNGAGTITINPGGKLGFWTTGTGVGLNNGTTNTWGVTLNGGFFGDTLSTSAAQTVPLPVTMVGSVNPTLTAANANATTLSGLITKGAGSTITEVSKRGAGLLVLSNAGNSFDVPLRIYSGNLQANYAGVTAGGLPPDAPVALPGTPLGTAPNVLLAGGTLNIRVDGENNANNQQFALGKNLVVDLAPSGVNLDRLTATGGSNKNVVVDKITFTPASAANNWSQGQNQLTMTQGNTFRLQLGGTLSMATDTVLNAGDFTIAGNIDAGPAGGSLVKTGGFTMNIVSGTHNFNALFAVGATNLRIGSGFGTTLTSDTVTAGSAPIYLAPGSGVTFRTPTNLATGQTIDLVSQTASQASVNLEQFTSIPSNLRALGTGVLGLGNTTAFGDIDLSRIGDGSFRLASNLTGSGNGTVVGTILPGTGNVVRVGGLGTLTVSGTDRIAGNASLEVGSALINGGFRSTIGGNQSGTVILTAANNFTGGTVVNRGSTLVMRSDGAIGNGGLYLAGTITLESTGNAGPHATLIGAGPVTMVGGGSVRFVNDAITDIATNTPDRWGNTTPMTLTAGSIEMRSRNIAAASDTIEEIGDLTVAGGTQINLQRLQAVTGHNVQLTANSLIRSGQATIELLRSTGTGAGYGGGQKLVLNNGAPTPSNGMVYPWIVAQNNGPIEFTTYGATGFNVLTAYDQTVAAPYTAGALNYDPVANTGGKVNVTTAALTLVDNPSIYVLRTDQSINSNGTNNTITLFSNPEGTSTQGNSGGALIANISTGTITVQPNLVFSNGTANKEGLIMTRSGGTLSLSGAVTANGLTKFGAGTLNLTTASPNLAGTLAINQGTVQLFGPTATATSNLAGTGLVQLAGGQLNLRSNNTAVTGTINTTLQNGISVARDIPIAVVDSNRSTADTASSGTFIFNPAAQGTGLQLLGATGPQGQTITFSGANYGVTFGSNALNAFEGNVTINNAVTLQLNNAPAITGTNPVFTKSGAGTLIVAAVNGIGSANNPGATVANGTKVVVNAGVLELRSLTSFGSGSDASIIMNGGTLNVRRDTTGGTYGGTGTGYPLTVNGNSTVFVGTVSAGSGQRLGLGHLTLNNDATVTLNNNTAANTGGTYGLNFDGASLNGNGFITSNITASGLDGAANFLSGFDVSGGSLIKQGTGHLHLQNALNTYDGGTYIQSGVLRARATGALGSGNVYLNPGGALDLNSDTNLGATQKLFVRSNSAFLPMISVNTEFAHPTTNVDTTLAPSGIIGLSNGTAGNYSIPINMATLYGGKWSLGGVSTGSYDPVYTASTLGAGAGNLYRLGGGGTAIAIGVDTTTNGRLGIDNVLTGANSVRFGFDSGNVLGANTTNFQFSLGGLNNYTGNTVIHRGMVTRLFAANDGTRSGLSNTAVDVFGVLSLSGISSLGTVTGQTNPITLHPGSALFFDNANGAANNAGAVAAGNLTDRWNDTTPIALNGALLNLISRTDDASSESVGNVTYSKGARIRVGRTNSTSGTSATAQLTLNNLTSGGPGSTLMIQTAAAGSLAAATNYDRLFVTNAPAITNGMVSSSIVNATDNTFLTYGANGFANVTYDKTLNATYAAGSLLPTDKVDVGTAALTLADEPVVYALRTSQNINVGGPFTTLTIRSGGFIGTGGTIQPNLIFNDGAANIEARMYVANTVAINGQITANGITKFGTGNLTINTPQVGYTAGWTVNSGTLQINDPQGLGSAPVTLNPSLSTGGQAGQNFAQTQLTFNRDNGTAELVTFSGGPITVNNEATIRIAGNGVNDRYLQIPEVILDSSSAASSVALTLDVPNNRLRGIIPKLTLQDDAVIRVFDSGSQGDYGRITAAVVNSLVGAGKNVTKLGNRVLELPGNNVATFTGGSLTASQGTIRVLDNGSLGSATTAVTFERNAALEIQKSNFVPTAQVTLLPGSIERWNVEDARVGNYNLPAGVNLQLNTNLTSATPRTIGLNGGSLEGYLWSDNVAQTAQRNVGAAVTVNLLADSFVGQNILQGSTYDTGRAPTVAQPFGDNITGALLRIDGNITGAFNLTKTGLDTVTLAGAANSYNNTSAEMGVLRIGRDNALPTAKTLTTKLGGIFDLYGFNQTVAGLGTDDAGPNPGGVSPGVSGQIVNSGMELKTLTVNNSAGFTYNGEIERNIGLTKSGAGKLTLGGANTYVGPTIVQAGTLAITGSISGSTSIDVRTGATLDTSLVTGGLFNIGANTLLTGGGNVLGAVMVDGSVAPGSPAGTLAVSGPVAFNTGSDLSIEIVSPAAFDQLSTSGLTLDGTVTLNIALNYVPAENTTFTIVNNTGTFPISGSTAKFTSSGPEGLLTENEVFFVNGLGFRISYVGGTGNDVVLTAIPEPSIGATLAGGIGLLLGLRRRRRA